MKDRIKQIRKENHLTQTEFGERIGVKGNTITNYENDMRKPSDAIIVSICREFNINEDWLRNGNEPMHNLPEEKFESYLGQISSGNDDFIKDLIEVYMELDQTSKDALKEIAIMMAKKQNEREQK